MNYFKNIISTIALILVLGLSSSYAQIIVTVTEHEQVEMNLDLNTNPIINFNSEMLNNSSDTVLVNWKAIEATIPEGWIVTVADLQLSYILNNLIDNNDGGPTRPMAFPPNLQNASFNLAFNPRLNNGCGEVKIIVFNDDTQEVYDTINYKLIVNTENCGLTSNENIHLSTTNIFPSPAYDFINIKGLTNSVKIEVVNASGQRIIKTTVNQNKQLDIAMLQSGIYFLHITNNNGLHEIHKFVKN